MTFPTEELQERYSNLVLQKLRKTSVLEGLFNKRYEGNPKAGAVKIPVRDTEVKVDDYDIVKGGALSNSTTSYQTLPIDKDKYVSELIDGYIASAVPDNLVADRLDSAGYSMGRAIDEGLANLLVTNGTESTGENLTPDNVYSEIVNDTQSLKKIGMDISELWMVVSNDMYGLLLKSPDYLTAKEVTVIDGAVGKIAGVPVYESNGLPEGVSYIIGNNVFCHFVSEFSVPITIRDLADGTHIGASAVQGRMVYGQKITRPETVKVKKSNVDLFSAENSSSRRSRR